MRDGHRQKSRHMRDGYRQKKRHKRDGHRQKRDGRAGDRDILKSTCRPNGKTGRVHIFNFFSQKLQTSITPAIFSSSGTFSCERMRALIILAAAV